MTEGTLALDTDILKFIGVGFIVLLKETENNSL